MAWPTFQCPGETSTGAPCPTPVAAGDSGCFRHQPAEERAARVALKAAAEAEKAAAKRARTVRKSRKTRATNKEKADKSPRNNWVGPGGIVEQAAAIVYDYTDTGITLRQLFYQLVTRHILANTDGNYSSLSSKTAEARRWGTFPDLIDLTREIKKVYGWESFEAAIDNAIRYGHLKRDEGQQYQVWVVVEKDGLLAQISNWFGNLHITITSLKGYCSYTHKHNIKEEVEADGRPAILLYVGDFDCSGEDLYRDLLENTDCWYKAIRVALREDQVLDLAESAITFGKPFDRRWPAFEARHYNFVEAHGVRGVAHKAGQSWVGKCIQVEVDSIAPDRLRSLIQDELLNWFDFDLYAIKVEAERAARVDIAARIGITL